MHSGTTYNAARLCAGLWGFSIFALGNLALACHPTVPLKRGIVLLFLISITHTYLLAVACLAWCLILIFSRGGISLRQVCS